MQLACCCTSRYQPLEQPWFSLEPGPVPLLQAFATCIAAVGSGVLLAGVLTGNVDGAGVLCCVVSVLGCLPGVISALQRSSDTMLSARAAACTKAQQCTSFPRGFLPSLQQAVGTCCILLNKAASLLLPPAGWLAGRVAVQRSGGTLPACMLTRRAWQLWCLAPWCWHPLRRYRQPQQQASGRQLTAPSLNNRPQQADSWAADSTSSDIYGSL